MTNSPHRPLSRREKTLFTGVPVLLLLAAGSVFVFARLTSRAVINFPPPALMPQPNGFDVYLKAADAITPAKPAVDAVDDAQNLTGNPALVAQRYSLARKTAWLNANSKGFALYQQALKLPCRHPNSTSAIGFKDYGKFRQLAREKVIEANAYKLRGDWNGAVTSALDVVQMGNEIPTGGPLIAKLVGEAMEAVGRMPLTTTDDPISKLNATQSRAATGRLEAIIKGRQSYTTTLENERWVSLRMFDEMRRQAGWRRGATVGPGGSLQEIVSGLLAPQSQIVASINQQFDSLIADSKQPFSAPLAKPPTRKGFWSIFGSVPNTRRLEARSVVTSNMLLLRLALRAYQADNGAFPASLGQLAPKYLVKVPTDTYADNAPFHYTKQGKSYLLYSIGPDGKDDKGVAIKWKKGRPVKRSDGRLPPLLLDSKGDYVAGANG